MKHGTFLSDKKFFLQGSQLWKCAAWVFQPTGSRSPQVYSIKNVSFLRALKIFIEEAALTKKERLEKNRGGRKLYVKIIFDDMIEREWAPHQFYYGHTTPLLPIKRKAQGRKKNSSEWFIFCVKYLKEPRSPDTRHNFQLSSFLILFWKKEKNCLCNNSCVHNSMSTWIIFFTLVRYKVNVESIFRLHRIHRNDMVIMSPCPSSQKNHVSDYSWWWYFFLAREKKKKRDNWHRSMENKLHR